MTNDTAETELLSAQYVRKHSAEFKLNESLFSLPEKVIQFGTGILLRGLVDYLIDKANKQNIFNGRVVIIKSTGNIVKEFTAQNNLYTLLEKGMHNGEAYEQKDLIACVSRVLPAEDCWQQILQCAADPAIEIVVSNTTEAGLVFEQETLGDKAPKTFPAKLAAYLRERYTTFKGDEEKGMVILPTELVSNNGALLKQFVLQHAADNHFDTACIEWIEKNNHFCNTLVDRIVPGKSEKDDIIYWSNGTRYVDPLHATVEPYLLWAIQGNKSIQQKLSFIQADKRAVVSKDIEGFKEQKLRILNGSNTTIVAPAYLAGLDTVYDTMTDPLFCAFTKQLINAEILPTIIESCPQAPAFAKDVLERFSNPFIRYPLLNIALQCSSKMNSRNAATILRYYRLYNQYPPLMLIGFACFLLFYSPAGKENDRFYGLRAADKYLYRDEHAGFLCRTLEEVDWTDTSLAEKSVSSVLNNEKIFLPELAALPDITRWIATCCKRLHNEGIRQVIREQLKF